MKLINLYHLKPIEDEITFRKEELPRDKKIVKTLLFFSMAFIFFTIFLDKNLLPDPAIFNKVLSIRIFIIALSFIYLLLVHKISSIKFFELSLFIWSFLLLSSVSIISYYLPANYIMHICWDILLAFAAYAILPLPLNKQFILAVLFTISDIYLFKSYKSLGHESAFSDLLLAFLCLHLIGIFISLEINIWKRKQYKALKTEEETRKKLEASLMEIKTIKGIIPICSHCKKIRTGENWGDLENYIRQNSDADFSHGICPECMKTLYPEIE